MIKKISVAILVGIALCNISATPISQIVTNKDLDAYQVLSDIATISDVQDSYKDKSAEEIMGLDNNYKSLVDKLKTIVEDKEAYTNKDVKAANKVKNTLVSDYKELGSSKLKQVFRADYVVASPYGKRLSFQLDKEENNEGVDFLTPIDTEVIAQFDGVVEEVGTSKEKGNYIKLKHGGNIETYYGYLKEVVCKKGDKVKQYQVIGFTGLEPTVKWPLLHYEVMLEGSHVDPLSLY